MQYYCNHPESSHGDIGRHAIANDAANESASGELHAFASAVQIDDLVELANKRADTIWEEFVSRLDADKAFVNGHARECEPDAQGVALGVSHIAQRGRIDGELSIPFQKGGSYREVKDVAPPGTETHHIPADSVTGLDTNDGPCISMAKEDHRQTASWGRSRDAQEYRAVQLELVQQGRFADAMQMDIDDIREKFGGRYDEAIEQMLEYARRKGLI